MGTTSAYISRTNLPEGSLLLDSSSVMHVSGIFGKGKTRGKDLGHGLELGHMGSSLFFVSFWVSRSVESIGGAKRAFVSYGFGVLSQDYVFYLSVLSSVFTACCFTLTSFSSSVFTTLSFHISLQLAFRTRRAWSRKGLLSFWGFTILLNQIQ